LREEKRWEEEGEPGAGEGGKGVGEWMEGRGGEVDGGASLQ